MFLNILAWAVIAIVSIIAIILVVLLIYGAIKGDPLCIIVSAMGGFILTVFALMWAVQRLFYI